MRNSNCTPAAIAEAKSLGEIGLKKCTTCAETKSILSFRPAKLGAGGIAAVCKSCSAKYERALRNYKIENDLLFNINRAILKKQQSSRHVCWLSEKGAHQAASHLLGEYGLLSPEDAHTFQSVFMNNLPDKIKRLEMLEKNRSEARVARERARAVVLEERAVVKEQAKLDQKLNRKLGIQDILAVLKPSDLTEKYLDRLVFMRLQYHLKNKRRKLKATEFSFTKLNFTTITGYTVKSLREHLSNTMPKGKTWLDVARGDLHIDHVLPSAAFDLTTLAGVRNCYALSNLTLMSAMDNTTKAWSLDKDTV